MPEAPKLIRLPLGNVYRATERLVVCRISIVPLKLQLKLLLLLLLLVLLLLVLLLLLLLLLLLRLLLLACVLVPTVLSQTVALPGVLACQTAKCAGVDGGSRGCSHMHQLAPEFFVMMPFSSPLQ